MSKGLKQMVAEATQETAEPVKPVTVSDEAHRALSFKMREWSGWRDATLVMGDPTKYGSPFACCDHNHHQFTANPERLVLNPNRVLLTVTPFRLRQEAVLTGALLHEAGHARYSKWQPRTSGAIKEFKHSDGTPVAKATIALARVMEEPRIEGLMARDAQEGKIGAAGLDWTMRASAAQLLPFTAMTTDPNQKIMDLITSWAIRAGRQHALAGRTDFTVRKWVFNFGALLRTTLVTHLGGVDTAWMDTDKAVVLLHEMILCDDHTGPTMVDLARSVLALLFPETPEGDQPEAGEGCSGAEAGDSGDESESESESGDNGEGDEEGADGEGNTEPEDEGSGEEPGAGDTGTDDTEDDSAEPGASDSTDETDSDEADTESELAKALRAMENAAKSDEVQQAEEQETGGSSGGAGESGDLGGGWRAPSKSEREIQHGAERFLRSLIAPTETSTVTLSDSPSSAIDPAAYAAWKAGGMVRAPMFFKRTRRSVSPQPPVKIAVLVDVSGSMHQLQKPSAILSWALAGAALDLRNFAGRGQQIESCLIHWGDSARVIQRNGQMLPGIREVRCEEGTRAMGEALYLVEEEMPGFFDLSDKPENRLLVQFTDWELSGWGLDEATVRVHAALASGVNMVTVAPHDYSERSSDLPRILGKAKAMRGTSTLMRYNKLFPEQVWDRAAESLAVSGNVARR